MRTSAPRGLAFRSDPGSTSRSVLASTTLAPRARRMASPAVKDRAAHTRVVAKSNENAARAAHPEANAMAWLTGATTAKHMHDATRVARTQATRSAFGAPEGGARHARGKGRWLVFASVWPLACVERDAGGLTQPERDAQIRECRRDLIQAQKPCAQLRAIGVGRIPRGAHAQCGDAEQISLRFVPLGNPCAHRLRRSVFIAGGARTDAYTALFARNSPRSLPKRADPSTYCCTTKAITRFASDPKAAPNAAALPPFTLSKRPFKQSTRTTHRIASTVDASTPSRSTWEGGRATIGATIRPSAPHPTHEAWGGRLGKVLPARACSGCPSFPARHPARLFIPPPSAKQGRELRGPLNPPPTCREHTATLCTWSGVHCLFFGTQDWSTGVCADRHRFACRSS